MKRRKTAIGITVLFALTVVVFSFSSAGPLSGIKSTAPPPVSPAKKAPVVTPVTPEFEVQPVGLPDLIIQAISSGSPARVGDRVEIPYSVRVRNRGGSPAGLFKVSVGYRFLSFPVVLAERLTVREGVVAFAVPGQRNAMFPFTTGPLNAGSEIIFTGKLIFPTIFDRSFDENTPRVRMRFDAFADSTQGEGSSVPSYGRVRESNESNNKSNYIDMEMSITRGAGDR